MNGRLSRFGRYCAVMGALEPAHGADVGRGVAASLLANVSGLAEDMHRYIVERIPEVGGDAELRGLTLGSCSSNLEAVLSMFRHGIDVAAAEAPVTALEHARAMASRGHSVDVMLRFYRLGHEYFTEKLSDSLTESIDDPTVALRTFIDLERFGFRYIDRISSLVAAEYVAELTDARTRQEPSATTSCGHCSLANVSTTPGPNVCSATGSPVSRSVSCAGSRTAASTLRNSLGGLVGFLGRVTHSSWPTAHSRCGDGHRSPGTWGLRSPA